MLVFSGGKHRVLNLDLLLAPCDTVLTYDDSYAFFHRSRFKKPGIV